MIMTQTDQKFISEDEMKMLRENFIEKYASEKGWNPRNLTEDQLMEIKNKREYKNPGLMLS